MERQDPDQAGDDARRSLKLIVKDEATGEFADVVTEGEPAPAGQSARVAVRRRHGLRRRHRVGGGHCARGGRLHCGQVEAGDDPADVLGALDRLDLLVCAHGISGRSLGDGPVDACTEDGWDAVLDANLRSTFVYCKHAVPLLRAAGGGAIVVVSSVLALVGGDEDFATHAYAASKAGQIGLPRAMAATYAPEGIRCNVVCPGLIETPMSRRVQEDERIRASPPELPMTGTFGRPEDVAEAVVYLATAPSSPEQSCPWTGAGPLGEPTGRKDRASAWDQSRPT